MGDGKRHRRAVVARDLHFNGLHVRKLIVRAGWLEVRVRYFPGRWIEGIDLGRLGPRIQKQQNSRHAGIRAKQRSTALKGKLHLLHLWSGAVRDAQNAVVIATAAGAKQYAPDSLAKAEDMLQRRKDYYQRKQGRTPIGTAARLVGFA